MKRFYFAIIIRVMDILKTIQDIINRAVDNGIVSFGAVLAMKDGKEAIRLARQG